MTDFHFLLYPFLHFPKFPTAYFPSQSGCRVSVSKGKKKKFKPTTVFSVFPTSGQKPGKPHKCLTFSYTLYSLHQEEHDSKNKSLTRPFNLVPLLPQSKPPPFFSELSLSFHKCFLQRSWNGLFIVQMRSWQFLVPMVSRHPYSETLTPYFLTLFAPFILLYPQGPSCSLNECNCGQKNMRLKSCTSDHSFRISYRANKNRKIGPDRTKMPWISDCSSLWWWCYFFYLPLNIIFE